ncbi:MAG: hypothetical protein AAF899_13955, partial [Pseudomonadota bacterium]
MKIRHERPMAELSFPVSAPLTLELRTNESITIPRWSLDGFEFPGGSDVLPKEAVLSIPFQGVDIRFPVRLARRGADRFLTFEGLSGRQRETLAVFYRSLLSGRMAATEDIITSLDTPVDLVPMGETEEEASGAAGRKSPRALRAMLSVALHLMVAGLVLWTLGAGVASRLGTVELRSARIEAILTPVEAPKEGTVAEILSPPGSAVAAGEVIARLTSPAGEAALAETAERLALVEDRLT